MLLVCTFMIGLAFAKEDYDFDVEAKNVKASVWGRVSYTDNESILPIVKDVVNYNIHLIGSDRNLITAANPARLAIKAYKKNDKLYKSIKIEVHSGRINVSPNEPWKISNNVVKVKVYIRIDGTNVEKTLTD